MSKIDLTLLYSPCTTATRAVKKEKNLYFWDWSRVSAEGPRFENFVTCQLLKYCHRKEGTEGFTMELRYLRDTDGREVDFVVLKDGSPEFAVECKTGEGRPSPTGECSHQRTPISTFYQVYRGTGNDCQVGSVRILPLTRFCRELELP